MVAHILTSIQKDDNHISPIQKAGRSQETLNYARMQAMELSLQRYQWTNNGLTMGRDGIK